MGSDRGSRSEQALTVVVYQSGIKQTFCGRVGTDSGCVLKWGLTVVMCLSGVSQWLCVKTDSSCV